MTSFSQEFLKMWFKLFCLSSGVFQSLLVAEIVFSARFVRFHAHVENIQSCEKYKVQKVVVKIKHIMKCKNRISNVPIWYPIKDGIFILQYCAWKELFFWLRIISKEHKLASWNCTIFVPVWSFMILWHFPFAAFCVMSRVIEIRMLR